MSEALVDRSCSEAPKNRRQEITLHKCQGDLRALLDAIPEPVSLKDRDGIYLDCNPAVERLFGRCKSDIVGKTDYDFLDRTQADFIRQQDYKACVSDKPLRYQKWLTFSDGRRRFYEVTKTSLRDTNGELVGIFSILRDISERVERKRSDKKLIQSEARFRCVLDSAADAIFIADQQGHYQYVNEQASRLLGYESSELLQMKLGDITPAEDREEVLILLQKLHSGSSLHCELRLRHRSGANIPVDFNATVLPDGRIYISYRDIRARKLADAEREQHRETLVREVHHRIKNNLQGVVGLLQLELGRFQELNPRLEVAISQVNAIAIVHGLQANFPGEDLRLGSSIREICRMISELVLRPVFLSLDDAKSSFDQYMVSPKDAVSIALILNELILNALKHSPSDKGGPDISLQADGTGVKLLIRNAATKIPDFHFETGERLGTGLSLVRSLLPEQGAHLNYKYDPDSGLMLSILTLVPPVLLEINKSVVNIC